MLMCQLSISFMEAARGCSKDVSFKSQICCASCYGWGYTKVVWSACKGRGTVLKDNPSEMEVGSRKIKFKTNCSACKGSGSLKKQKCSSCKGSGNVEGLKKVRVTIPAGIDSGHIIRIPRAGNINKQGDPRTLRIKVMVAEDPVFKRKGSDLYVDSNITFIQAIIGGKVEVPTLNGRTQVKIPKGVFKYGYLTKLRGKGLPKKSVFVSHGDQYVRFCYDFPEVPNDQEIAEWIKFYNEERSSNKNWWLRLSINGLFKLSLELSKLQLSTLMIILWFLIK